MWHGFPLLFWLASVVVVIIVVVVVAAVVLGIIVILVAFMTFSYTHETVEYVDNGFSVGPVVQNTTWQRGRSA